MRTDKLNYVLPPQLIAQQPSPTRTDSRLLVFNRSNGKLIDSRFSQISDFQLTDAQSLAALERLVKFAAENGVLHIVYSVAKIVAPRYKPMPKAIQLLKGVYEHVARPDKLVFRGGSWRLPHSIAQKHIVKPFLKICDSYDMKACFCKQNLLSTP